MNKLWWRLATALSLIFLLSSAYLFIPQTFFSLDNRLRDFLFVLRGPIQTSEHVVIVDIDEKSLRQEGQWPWSRDKMADLLNILTEAEAGIIGLDIVFSEPDKSSPKRIASQLKCADDALIDYDEVLAQSVTTTPTIGGYFFDYSRDQTNEAPLIPAVFLTKGGSNLEYLLSPTHLVLNIPIIQDALYSSGFFNNTPDEDGMIRLVPLLMYYDQSIYPSLALEMVRIYTGAKKVVFDNANSNTESITMGTLQIPTDRLSRLMVNYRGPSHSFTYVSAVDILSHHFKAEDIAGKFILIGTSAVALSDLRATPFDILMPGVEVHANVIDNLLTGDFISFGEEPEQIDIALIALTVILTTVIFSVVPVWSIIPLLLWLYYAYYLLFDYLLFQQGLALNILFPLAALMFSFVTTVLIDYFISLSQKRAIMSIFAKKVSPTVMDDLIKNSSEKLLTPHNKEVTIFFSDIRSFTSISEKLGSPERVINMLNTYMTPMVESITHHQGTVDKFIGDAVMAYWNAPVPVENHADQAIHSALEQQQMLLALNSTLLQEFDVEIAIGIGIHTGLATIGEMGSTGRSDYTIIGDNVNLASRLEGLTKLYGVKIIISFATKTQLTQTFHTRSLDIVKVKGKKEAIEIFEVMTHPLEEAQLQQYKKALKHYRDAEIPEALRSFQELETLSPSTLYKLYIRRCQNALDNGLEHFETVTTMQTK